MVQLHEWEQRLKVELAAAINQTAELIIRDISETVPFDTGRLASRWTRHRPCQPEDDPKSVEVGPPPSYGIKLYPFTRSFGTRSRRFYGDERTLLFQPGEGVPFQARVITLYGEQVQEAVRRSLS